METRCYMSSTRLANPNSGELNLRMVTQAMMPSTSSPYTLDENSLNFTFNPIQELASLETALSYFSTQLSPHFAWDPHFGTQVARNIATIAYNEVHTGLWSYGLSILMVVEIIHNDHEEEEEEERLSHPRPEGFQDGLLALNDPSPSSSSVQDSNDMDDAILQEMIRTFGSVRVNPRVEVDSNPGNVGGLSERDISRLETRQLDSDTPEEYCPVCLEEFKEGEIVTALSPCLHKFHNVCISRWLRENRTCPVCRSTCIVD